MIRLLLGLLIVVNVVIFLWGRNFITSADQGIVNVPKADVPSIRLTKEVVPEAIAKKEILPFAEAVEDAPMAAERVVAMETEVEQIEPEVVEAPAPESEAVIEVELTLAQPEKPEWECGRIGPFKTESDLETTRADLMLDLSEVEQTRAEEQKGYWVLIPALPSRVEGKKMMIRLREAGYKDVWLFNSGSLKNAISLGLFNVKDYAESHAAEINKKGFASEVAAKTIRTTQFWLKYRGTVGKMGLDKIPEKIKINKKACN